MMPTLVTKTFHPEVRRQPLFAVKGMHDEITLHTASGVYPDLASALGGFKTLTDAKNYADLLPYAKDDYFSEDYRPDEGTFSIEVNGRWRPWSPIEDETLDHPIARVGFATKAKCDLWIHLSNNPKVVREDIYVCADGMIHSQPHTDISARLSIRDGAPLPVIAMGPARWQGWPVGTADRLVAAVARIFIVPPHPDWGFPWLSDVFPSGAVWALSTLSEVLTALLEGDREHAAEELAILLYARDTNTAMSTFAVKPDVDPKVLDPYVLTAQDIVTAFDMADGLI